MNTNTTTTTTTATASGQSVKVDDTVSYFVCKKVGELRFFLAKSKTLVDARVALKEHLTMLNYSILPDANPVYNKDKPIDHGQSFLVQKTDAMKSKYLDEWLEYCNFVHQSKPSSFWTNAELVTTYTPILVCKYGIMQICGSIPTFPSEPKSSSSISTWNISDSQTAKYNTSNVEELKSKSSALPLSTSPAKEKEKEKELKSKSITQKPLPAKEYNEESAQQISKRASNLIKSIYSVETATCINFNVFSEIAILTSKMNIEDTNELINWVQTAQANRRSNHLTPRADLYNLIGYLNYFLLSNQRAALDCFRIAANLGYPLAMYYLINMFEESDNWSKKFAATNYRTPYN